MGGSESKSEDTEDTGSEMTTKKTVCTTISGGKRRKRSYHKRSHQTHHKRSHSKRHSRRR